MTATTAANYLLYIMGEAFDDLTNKKLNKLLYFAQGHYLKKYGRPLFNNVIEAWEHGPVVPEVYSTYKEYGDKPIKRYDSNMIAEITPETEGLLFNVARQYGRYTVSKLQNMACVAGSPWDQVCQGEHSHTKIPLTAEGLKPIRLRYSALLRSNVPLPQAWSERVKYPHSGNTQLSRKASLDINAATPFGVKSCFKFSFLALASI